MLLGHANELADALPTGDTLHSAGCSLKTAPRATFTLLMAAALAAGSGAEIKLRVPYDSDDRIDEVEVLQDDRWLPVQDLGWTPPSAAEPFAAARRLGAASSGVSGGPETYEPCPGIASGNSTESVAVDDDLRRTRASQVRRRDLGATRDFPLDGSYRAHRADPWEEPRRIATRETCDSIRLAGICNWVDNTPVALRKPPKCVDLDRRNRWKLL